MSDETIQCLAHGFGGEIETLECGVMLNGAPLPFDCTRQLNAEQPFRPVFMRLEKSGYRVEPDLGDTLPEAGFAIVLAGQSRDLNQRNFIRAWNALSPGGPIFVAGARNGGINPLRKLAQQLAGEVEAKPKYHALALRAERRGKALALPPGLENCDGFTIPVGTFSQAGPDPASRLLASHFSGRLSGRCADLGAGWGYLTESALKTCSAVTSIDLYEADWRALEAARTNLSGYAGGATGISFHWCDVTTEFARKPYDCIIMNPPFHAGREAVPALGRAFIETAAATLVPGGRLIMVANRNLPYEERLSALFRHYEMLADEGGFKVLLAIR